MRAITLREVSIVTVVLNAGSSSRALPAVIEGDPSLGLEPAAVIGLGAAAAPPIAVDRNGKFRKRRSHPPVSEGAVTGGCLRA